MKKRVSWNERNLSEIEANKPERKKIDEPKTPFPSTIEQDGSFAKSISFAAHAEALKNALDKLALGVEHDSRFREWTSSDEEDETGRDEDRGLEEQRDAVSFEERRRAHYDEFKKAKELQEKDSFLDDDDHGNGIRISGSCSTLGIIESIEIEIEDCDEILLTIGIEENGDSLHPAHGQV